MRTDRRSWAQWGRGAVAIALLAFALLGTAGDAGGAASAPSKRRPGPVVLILVDGLSLRDIDESTTPSLWTIATTGAIALMNPRTAKTLQPEHTYVTIGAGTRAEGPPEAGSAFGGGEELDGVSAASTYASYTGEPNPGPDSVVQPFIALIRAANSQAHYDIVPGALGGALRRAGKRTAVFGNSDTPGRPGRHAVAIAMDERGVVDVGEVGEAMVAKAPDFPGGLRTDVGRLTARVEQALRTNAADLVVVETGDLARVERYAAAGVLTAAADAAARRAALAAADAVVGRVLEAFGDGVALVLAPTPSAREVAAGRSLTPILAIGDGLSRGLLTSATTRRDGLVANTDVAASVLAWLGVAAPPWVLGTPVSVRPQPTNDPAIGRLGRVLNSVAAASLVRPRLLKGFVAVQIVTTAAALVAVGLAAAGRATRARAPGGPSRARLRSLRFSGVVRAVLAALAAVPLAWLLLPLAGPPPGALAAALLTAAAASALSLAAFALARRATLAFAGVYLATGLAVLVDALLGAELMKDSILGYDLVGGARFFGIGNEYMGALVGSLITGCGLVLDELDAAAGRGVARGVLGGVGLVFGAATIELALPSVGANMGGTVTAAAGFGAAYLLFVRRRVTRRDALALVLAALTLVVGIAIADSRRTGGPASHLGRTVLLVRSEGLRAIADAAQRKAAMSLKLMRYTAWTRALFAFLAALALLWVRPAGPARAVMKAHPHLASSLAACLVAVVGALAANDSGVVAAAMVTLYPAIALLRIAVEETPD